MAQASVNGVTLEYERLGERREGVILLIMGLSRQLTGWPLPFCDLLMRAGYEVVRYDNRDVGLSRGIEGTFDFNGWMAAGGPMGAVSPPYTVSDMADDAAGLLDVVGADRAHVVGVSMGGMIGQRLCVAHPERVLSFTSIMSTTGAAHVPGPTPAATEVLFAPAPNPNDREAIIAAGIRSRQVIGSPAWPQEEAKLRAIVEAERDRAYNPVGVGRQLAAILADGDRSPLLKSITVPTLVIHGDQDPLVNVEGGRHTAASIPGAELMIVPGMGHDIPPELYVRLTDVIVANCQRARATA